MTDTPEHPDPWDVSLPAPFDAREIYEYATRVGAERRGQRRRRQLVLTICGCLVVALTAAGIGLSGGDGGETSLQVATQASIPRAPVRSKDTVPPPKHRDRASAPRKSAAPPPAPPITSQCHAFARLTSANLTAFHALPLPLPLLDTTTTEPTPETTTTTTTTTTTLPPPPPTTTTTRPPTTTPTTRHTTPPTRIRVSPDTVFTPPALPGDPPGLPSPLLRPRRTRC